MKLFQMDIETLEITEVTPKTTSISLEDKNIHKVVKWSEGKLYVQAINKKNAKRKFEQVK
jgi:hypothetical protein